MSDPSLNLDVSQLRTLLLTHGPAVLFATLSALCAEEAKQQTDADEIEFWEIARDAAADAAAALSDDDDDEEGAEEEAETTACAPNEKSETHEKPSANETRTTNETTNEEGKMAMTADIRLGERPKIEPSHWRVRWVVLQ